MRQVRRAEPAELNAVRQHRLLLGLLRRAVVHDGDVERLRVTPSKDGNASWRNIIAHCCLPRARSQVFGHSIVVIVNYSGHPANAHVVLPARAASFSHFDEEVPSRGSGDTSDGDDSDGSDASDAQLTADASAGAGHGAGAGAGAARSPGDGPTASTLAVILRDLLGSDCYERNWTTVTDPDQGLWVGLEPWQAHAFEVVSPQRLL